MNLLTRMWRRQPDDEISRYTTADYIRQLTQGMFGLNPFVYAGSTTYSKGRPSERVENSYTGYVYGAYKINPIVYGLMQVRSSVFSQARLMWRERVKGKAGKLFWTDELKVLERPWPNGSTSELLSRMIQDVDLAGNAYVVRDGNRLRRLRPDWVQIVLSGNPLTDPDVDVVGYTYTPGGPDNGEGVPYLPDEMSHWSPDPDPIAMYRGMSWLTPVVREVMADQAATQHKLNFFNNGATLGPIFRLPKEMTKEQFEKFKAIADAGHQGTENAYKPMYVGGGADVTLSAATLQQLDFSSTQGAGEVRLCVAAMVPAPIAGVSEGLKGSPLNSGNFGVARRLFSDLGARRLFQSACVALSSIVAVPDDAELWFDPTDIAFFHEDQQDAANIAQTKMATVVSAITGGFEPAASVETVAPEWSDTLAHSGLMSVQLTPPGSQPADTINGPADTTTAPADSGQGAPVPALPPDPYATDQTRAVFDTDDIARADADEPDTDEPVVAHGLYVGRDEHGDVQVRWVGDADVDDPDAFDGADLSPEEFADLADAFAAMAETAGDAESARALLDVIDEAIYRAAFDGDDDEVERRDVSAELRVGSGHSTGGQWTSQIVAAIAKWIREGEHGDPFINAQGRPFAPATVKKAAEAHGLHFPPRTPQTVIKAALRDKLRADVRDGRMPEPAKKAAAAPRKAAPRSLMSQMTPEHRKLAREFGLPDDHPLTKLAAQITDAPSEQDAMAMLADVHPTDLRVVAKEVGAPFPVGMKDPDEMKYFLVHSIASYGGGRLSPTGLLPPSAPRKAAKAVPVTLQDPEVQVLLGEMPESHRNYARQVLTTQGTQSGSESYKTSRQKAAALRRYADAERQVADAHRRQHPSDETRAESRQADQQAGRLERLADLLVGNRGEASPAKAVPTPAAPGSDAEVHQARTIAELRALAKARGITVPSGLKKDQIREHILRQGATTGAEKFGPEAVSIRYRLGLASGLTQEQAHAFANSTMTFDEYHRQHILGGGTGAPAQYRGLPQLVAPHGQLPYTDAELQAVQHVAPQFQAEQVAKNRAHNIADLLAHTEALRESGASPQAMESRIRSHGKATPELADRLVQVHTPAELDRVASQYGLTRTTPNVGGVEPYNPALHERLPGSPDIPAGTPVQIVRPGYDATVNGTRVQAVKAAVILHEPAEARHFTSAEVDRRIMAAHEKIRNGSSDLGAVPLADLRRELPDIPRDQLDARLEALAQRQDVHLFPQENQKLLTAADRAAAVTVGRRAYHFLHVEPGRGSARRAQDPDEDEIERSDEGEDDPKGDGLTRGHPYPGQRYTHGWVPVAGGVRASLARAANTARIGLVASAEAKAITGRDIQFDLGFQAPQTAREHCEAILRGLEKYPDVQLEGVRQGAPAELERPGVAAVTDVERGQIYFTTYGQSGGDRVYRSALARSQALGDLVVGTPEGVAMHEFGHLISSPFAARMTAKGLASDAGVPFDDFVAESISNYATESDAELGAEAFADVMINGSGASALSKAIVGEIDSVAGITMKP